MEEPMEIWKMRLMATLAAGLCLAVWAATVFG
jgi:hypothetical protein